MKVSIFFLFLMAPLFCLSAEQYRDPFDSVIPVTVEVDEAEYDGKDVSQIADEEVELPPLSLEGIIWDTEREMVIIDGEVYTVNDKLKDIDAKVYKIEPKAVYIHFKGKLYKKTIKGGIK